MDLEHFVSNRELLERLSREYELLKASGAEVDYAAWVRQRLREAAAELAGSVVNGEPHGHERTHATDVKATGEGAGPGQGTATGGAKPQQLAFSRPSSKLAPGHTSHPSTGLGEGHMPETAWFLRGEGDASTSQTLTTAIFGPTRGGPWAATAGPHRPSKTPKSLKRVVVVSPQRSPAPRPSGAVASQAAQQQAPQPPTAPPVSKLYTKQEPGLFTARPEAYVHPEARPRRTPAAAKRPDWVNAASLQAALKGASSAVPHLQAAAERERRLALSTALARQTLAAGLGPDEARAAALYGATPGAAAAQAVQYDHVLLVAQQLAQQNEQLARAVQENSVALAQQQALLDAALQQRASSDGPDLDAAGKAIDPATTAARVEVESGPPPWFVRTASSRQAKASTTGSKASKPRSLTTALQPVPLSATTVKQVDRTTRKEQLKALLKEILGGAGKTGGEEGRRRLASGMAEAEKLVAAIQALASVKAGKGAKGGRPSGGKGGSSATAAGYTGTRVTDEHRDASTLGERASGAAEPADASAHALAHPSASQGPSRAHSEGPSRAPSLGPSRVAQTVPTVPVIATGAVASGPNSRPVSREGSVLSYEQGRSALPDAQTGAAAAAATPEAVGAGPLGTLEVGGAGGPAELVAVHYSAQTLPPALAAPAPAAGNGVPNPAGASSISASNTTFITGAVPYALNSSTTAAAAQAVSPAAFATSVGVPHGVMVESLEDQVQQIVERDAAAYAEAARLRKIDALEQRLHAMVDKVENKLARVLQPLQLNGQQPLQQPALPQGGWELRLGPDGQLLGEPAADGAAYDTSGVVGAGLAGAAGAAGGSNAGHGGGVYVDGVTVPGGAGLSVLELQRMLIQLNRMESKEQEVRRKWFHDSKGPKPRGLSVHPIVVRDGEVGTLDPAEPSPSPPTSPHVATRRASSPAPRVPGAGLWSFAHPPTESALATIAVDSKHARSGGPAQSMQAVVGSARAAELDPISSATLESVLRGRRRYMRAQQLADGDLLASANPSLNPVQIMEDVAEALLDEMLREQAQELLGFCDSLGEHVFKDEFNIDDEDNKA